MFTQADLDEARARFEAARNFDDDHLFFAQKTTPNTSRRSTVTSIGTINKPAVTNKKPDFFPAHKKWAGQAAKGTESKPAVKEVVRKDSTVKWDPTYSWEPSAKNIGHVQQDYRYAPQTYQPRRGYAPGEISGYGGEVWGGGWRFDEYGRPIRVVSGEVESGRLAGEDQSQPSHPPAHPRAQSSARMRGDPYKKNRGECPHEKNRRRFEDPFLLKTLYSRTLSQGLGHDLEELLNCKETTIGCEGKILSTLGGGCWAFTVRLCLMRRRRVDAGSLLAPVQRLA
jgi:hypothetical protein